ncbi:MAG: hypothetical protein HY735_36050 [Verrucomicrobia bacterium]|nr:hypothetical protein [Verrucomicrobiota bacterium]
MKLRILKNNRAKHPRVGVLPMNPIRFKSAQPAVPLAATAGRIRIHRVRFEFVHSTADRVCVAGSFNDWRPEATPMIPCGNGHWRKELGLPSGTFEYCLVVDGEWMADSAAKKTVPNPYGGINSVLMVGQCA